MNSEDVKELHKLTLQLQKLRVQEQKIVDRIESLARPKATRTPNKRYDKNGKSIEIGDICDIVSPGQKKSTTGTVFKIERRFIVLHGNIIDKVTKRAEEIRREPQNLRVLNKL